MAVVTQITLLAGGPSVHITVADQNGNPLPPANIVWSSASDVSIVADATGFLFSLGASAPAGSAQVAATYSGPLASAPVVGPELGIVEVIMVTSLEYLSP